MDVQGAPVCGPAQDYEESLARLKNECGELQTNLQESRAQVWSHESAFLSLMSTLL